MNGQMLSEGQPPAVQPEKKRFLRFLGSPRWYIWGLVVVLALITGYSVLAVQKNLWPFQVAPVISPLIGGDRDAHGCIGSAGYQWCEEKQKCLRIWEEKCATTSSYSDISTWQTYKSSQHGFELSYPGYFSKSGPSSVWTDGSILNLMSRTTDQFILIIHTQPLKDFVYTDQSAGLSYKFNGINWVEIHGYDNENEFVPKKITVLPGVNSFIIKTADGGGKGETVFIEDIDKKYVLELIMMRNISYVDCVTPCPDQVPMSDDSTINRILSTLKFIEPIPDYKSLNFQCDDKYECYGIVNVTGYVNISHRECVVNSPCSETVDYVLFNVIKSDSVLFSEYLKNESGNAFIGGGSIGLGCYQKDTQQITSINFADDGSTNNVISGTELTRLLSGTEQNPVQLTAVKSLATGGRGAPDCYSYFKHFSVQ